MASQINGVVRTLTSLARAAAGLGADVGLLLNAGTRTPADYPCGVDVQKGDELGWFEHGSTIILLAPAHFQFCGDVTEGGRILAGQALLRNV
jgi:hypothetical protein